MEELKINKANVLTAYKEATSKGKALLENLFGKNIFAGKITDRVKTFEDALREVGNIGENTKTLLAYNGTDRDMQAACAYAKLAIVARALNEGWKPDWTNSKEYKYYPWFEHKAGFGLSDFGYDCVYSGTYVGSRLCFKSEELARYAGKQFEKIYQDYLNY